MSTYWYLECTSHDPPLRSSDEVEQHTTGLPAIRELVARRGDIALMCHTATYGTWFLRNASTFLIQHPECPLKFVNEYDKYAEVNE